MHLACLLDSIRRLAAREYLLVAGWNYRMSGRILHALHSSIDGHMASFPLITAIPSVNTFGQMFLSLFQSLGTRLEVTLLECMVDMIKLLRKS